MLARPLALAPIGAALFLCFLSSWSFAIALGQIDDFQTGTTLGWSEGAVSPNPPTNVADGGPTGPGDHYLQNVSSGGVGAGSNMVMYNRSRWAGDYVAAGVDRIVVAVANFGATNLHVRIAIEGAFTRFASRNATLIPPDGIWRLISFDLSTTGLVNVSGTGRLNTVLAGVTEMRILSAQAAASWVGDNIAGVMGVDNIHAMSSVIATQQSTWGAVKALYER